MDTAQVVKEVGQLARPMWPDDEHVHVVGPAEELVGHHLFKAVHEKVRNEWGKWQTHRHTISLLYPRKLSSSYLLLREPEISQSNCLDFKTERKKLALQHISVCTTHISTFSP
jgi:hypothetical protein